MSREMGPKLIGLDAEVNHQIVHGRRFEKTHGNLLTPAQTWYPWQRRELM
jgi:hypothetical protein